MKQVLLAVIFCAARGSLSPVLPSDMNDFAPALQRHVEVLSGDIGERNFLRYASLEKAALYIERTFQEFGYSSESQLYEWEGRLYRNISASRTGKKVPEQIVVVGAHYDTVPGSPGADDNASGVSALLELARSFVDRGPARTVRFVAFTNEEPPFFRTRTMGSRVYARAARQKGEKIIAMVCLEMVGYFSDRENVQEYPLPFMDRFYPPTADFIAVVGNLHSRSLVRQVEKGISAQSAVGVESLATFTWVPGVDFSDHYSFYKEGYPAVMVTDTAFYRNRHYHSVSDTSETLDYASMAQVVIGLRRALIDLAE